MLKGEMTDIPVYIFAGFLESGKTTFIQECLEDEFFNDGERTLLLVCEEGEEELNSKKFASKNVFPVLVEKEEHLTEEWLSYLQKKYKIQKVMVEFNGMWNLGSFIGNSPESWVLYQAMCHVDSSTFEMYNANMRNLVADKFKNCHTVVFNRYDDKYDQEFFHKTVRTFNKRSDILYEYVSGNVVQDNIEDPLPFDIDADVIEVEDDDYAIFYREVNEEPEIYDGKTVLVKGRTLTDGRMPEDCFVFGRHVMTCCVEDIEFCGLVGRMAGGVKGLTHSGWAVLKARISEEKHPIYNGEVGPVLDVIEITDCDEPEEEVAVFY